MVATALDAERLAHRSFDHPSCTVISCRALKHSR
jgi:hypothetical protein